MFASQDLEKLKVLLYKAKKILVLGHVNPDGDCYGMILAWHYYLKTLDKEHDLFAPGRSDASFDFLPDYYQVKNDRELLAKDYDLVIINDLNAWERTGLSGYLQDNPNLKLLQVDHHEGKISKTDLSFVQPSAAASCQLLYFLWTAAKVEINKDMATALLTGIISDSNHYQTSAVTSDTFEASAALQNLGADGIFIGRQLKRLSLDKLQFFGEILKNNLVLHQERQLIIAVVPLELWEKYDLPVSDLDLLYGWLLSVEGYQHVLALKEQSIGEIRISWRSKGEVETNRISAIFGGGGHAQASSFTLYNHKLVLDENGKYQLQAL